MDTTSFAVSGEYAPGEDEEDAGTHMVAVTYGYSRDHRADLKQWMLAFAATRHRGCAALPPGARRQRSDKVSLVEAVEALGEQLHGEAETPIFVADSGLYSAENMTRLTAASVRWISRAPETSTTAKEAVQAAVLEANEAVWQQAGGLFWALVAHAPQGERWVVARTSQGVEGARVTLARKGEQMRAEWEKALWRLSVQHFACEPDAQAALKKQLTKRPEWIVALSLVMVLCLLVYRLAEHRLREQLAATGQTVPNQLSKPTDRPTLRWIFQVFEGLSLLTFRQPAGPPEQAVTGLEPLHEQVLALLGPTYEKYYKPD